MPEAEAESESEAEAEAEAEPEAETEAERAFWSIAQMPTRIGPSSIRRPTRLRSPAAEVDLGTMPTSPHMSCEFDFGIGRLGSSCRLLLFDAPGSEPTMRVRGLFGRQQAPNRARWVKGNQPNYFGKGSLFSPG